jgi:threonine dehydrogenase-like Zn-dependent dehydrogenase
VDIAFDAAGLANGTTLNTAIRATRSLGTVTNIAIYGAPVSIDLHALYMGEKTLNGIIGELLFVLQFCSRYAFSGYQNCG